MSLSTSLTIAVRSLSAATGALQIANNNIANANTPGYVRQLATLQEAEPFNDGTMSAGNGVVLTGYQSARDELLQTLIQQQTQAQSGTNAQLSSLQQIEPLFTTSTQDIGTQMSALFSSISSLSTNPASSPARQAVLVAGNNLATAFNRASNSLTSLQVGLNSQVTQDVSLINTLTEQIAALNPQIAQLKASGQDSGTLQNQQDQLVLTLSALTGVGVTKADNGITLTTGSGTPLVVGSQSFSLQTKLGSDGMQHVLDQNGTDITTTLSSGDLGGTVQMRDQTIPGLLSQLDTLASQFGTAFNAVQTTGFDQKGAAGQNFFIMQAAIAGSAASIRMAIADPTLIAASSDGSAGSNGNLANLSAIQAKPLPSGNTPGDSYANLVFNVGSLTANATATSGAVAASLLQLKNQLNSVSGVSIDEESTNLITYQQAYEAAARVVSTIQSLYQVTMSMGTAAAA